MLSNILLSSLSSPFLAMAAVGKTLQWLYNSNFSVQLLNPYQICTEKAMATHSSILAWRIDRGDWWAAAFGVTQSRTRLKRRSSSSSSRYAGYSLLTVNFWKML